MIADPWSFYPLAIIATLIIAISKGGFAGGNAIVGVPIMALVIDPVMAAGIILPLLVFMDVIAVRAYWRRWDIENVLILVPASLIGLAIGWASFRFFNADMIRLLLGVISLVFSLNYWFRQEQIENRPPAPRSRPKGTLWGSVSGFTTFISHAGAPPFAIYMLPQKLDRTTYQATSVFFFASVNLLKLGPYATLGLLDTSNLMISLYLAPCVPVGMALGIWLHKKVSDLFFSRFMYAGLTILGVKLSWDGLTALL